VQAEKLAVLLACAVAHHFLDAGPVVPRPVEEHDLSGSWQVCDIAVEVPLAAFSFGRLGQSDDPRGTRVEVLHKPFDCAALAGCIAALEQDHVLGASLLRPVLKLQQLDLKCVLFPFVVFAVHPFLVRIIRAPGLDWVAARVDQIRIRTMLIVPH
jgi:hypothetical protein